MLPLNKVLIQTIRNLLLPPTNNQENGAVGGRKVKREWRKDWKGGVGYEGMCRDVEGS